MGCAILLCPAMDWHPFQGVSLNCTTYIPGIGSESITALTRIKLLLMNEGIHQNDTGQYQTSIKSVYMYCLSQLERLFIAII